MPAKKRWMWPAVALAAAGLVAGGVWFWARPAPAAASEGPLRSAEIEHVYSGAKVKLDSGQELVYAGIRAPHPGEPGYEQAKQRNTELTEGEDVRLRFDVHERNDKDQLVAYVSVPEGMVNEVLVREGLAYVRLTPDERRFADKLLEAQAQARRQHAGLWADHRTLDRPGVFPADPKYGNYHREACEEVAKIKPERLKVFKTQATALAEGFAPCSKCRP
jgi:endonuclease YncB( thermonuclease family)